VKIKSELIAMNIGVGQTIGTCWFFSSLNMFLTSDNGLKILWKKLQETLPKLSARQRNYFNSNINVPCPYKGGVKKTSAIYFWKFLNQYICAVGGPGRLIPKSGLNTYLTKNIKWRTEAVRESKGQSPGFPHNELPVILGHLGFKIGSDFRMLDFERWKYQFKKDNWTAPILMYRSKGSFNNTTPLRDLLLEKKGYELTGAIVYAQAREGGAHVWACTIRNGKGYITDSNYPTEQKPLNWWEADEVRQYFRNIVEYPHYRLNAAKTISFDVIMYTRKDYTNKIAPYCLMPPGGRYRPLTNTNQESLKTFKQNYGNYGVPVILSGNVHRNIHGNYSARVLAEATRKYGKRPLANAAFYNKIVNNSTSFNNGIRMARTATKNGLKYIINDKGKNFMNFKQKLIAKHPRPFPNDVFRNIWGRRFGNMNFIRKVKNYAYELGYVFPKEKIQALMAKRQTTRAGAKRKRSINSERIYRINNTNWVNNNGTYVNPNPNNWVRTNGNAETNNAIRFMLSNNGPINKIETFRRKTFRDI
jgi:hypothetical protein